MKPRTRNSTVVVVNLLAASFVLFASLVLSTLPAIAQDQASVSDNPCKCWIDAKTAKKVPTIPMGGGHYEDISPGNQFTQRKWVPDVQIGPGPDHAFNTNTGQNYVREPCPPPTEKKVIEEKKEVCDFEFGYD